MWHRFLLTILSKAAKNARMWEMNWRLLSDKWLQSTMTVVRLISLTVQKEALAFFYMCQMSGCWMGNRTKR